MFFQEVKTFDSGNHATLCEPLLCFFKGILLFWERFLGAVEVLKLQVPKQQNSLEETQQWLTEGGVISAVKSFYFLEEHDALGGLERVGTMLDKARYSTSLSSKLTAHLQRINRTDLIPYIQYDTKHGKGGI